MKEEGAEETKRRSVRMPVSTLLNSRRVWSPAIWPEAERGRRRRRRRGMKGWKRRRDTDVYSPVRSVLLRQQFSQQGSRHRTLPFPEMIPQCSAPEAPSIVFSAPPK